MKLYFSKKIRDLAVALNKPIYAVGGYTRNYLIDNSLSKDIDLCAPIKVDELIPFLDKIGFYVVCEYKRTCTIVFSDDENRYEFTSFRKEIYDKGGSHTPISTEFTEDIYEDAVRRDFKCNSVYYDIKKDLFIDPLGGMLDIKNKQLSTVTDSNEVFSHDGLRLLRLVRFSGELNFKPTKETVFYAKQNAKNILDISKERVFEEVKKILICDKKYPFSDKTGHYNSLKLLDEIGVFSLIFPELTKGRGMPQRNDFHNYDVLEHSFRTVLYADCSIRLSALLHDIGKPYAMEKDGKYRKHNEYGEKIVREVLSRLKFDKKTIEEVAFLTLNHMIDLNGDMSSNKVKWFIVQNYNMIDKLLLIKQADFSACKDDLSISPSVAKWKGVLQKMQEEKTPLSVKELNVSAKEIIGQNVPLNRIGDVQKLLLKMVVCGDVKNEREKLLKIIATIKN